MKGAQSKKGKKNDKSIPRFLGRMVNLFDLSAGVTRNKRLTDLQHRQGSLVANDQSDVAKMSSPTFKGQIEDKKIVSELRRASSEKKVNGTPMKMLIEQEMIKDVDGKQGPPSSLVARLMGLETLPEQKSQSAAFRSHSKDYSQNALISGIPVDCWQQQDCFSNKDMHFDIHPCPDQNFRDVHELWKQPEKPNHVREKSTKKGARDEDANEKDMALIRQKFVEAKRMSMDEKLRQSKEYYDALEVLSSNRELFLKFLQEPNSLFSQSLAELKSVPSTPNVKRITVLRPSKQVDNQKFTGSGKKNDEPTNRPPQLFQTPSWESNMSSYSPASVDHKLNEPAHPMRIVVLKPSPMRVNDTKEPDSSPCVSPRVEGFGEGPEYAETRHPREMAKKITEHMFENLIGDRRDETLLSSVYSNGYVGDESSSFNKSDNEYSAGSLSDSDVMSPSSRHSWDYVNKFGSPYSCSSFSHASCSPESSVCREAKKRLSERWAMMATNGDSHENHVQKSSSTLGEMLALFDTKKSTVTEDDSGDKEEEICGLSSKLTRDHHEDSSSNLTENLLRSNSLPISSSVSDVKVNKEATDPETNKTHSSMELMKSKNTKSSLKGKVSSILFSRSGRTSTEEYATECKDDSFCPIVETAGYPVPSSGKTVDVSLEFFDNKGHEEGKSSDICQSSPITSSESSSGRHNCEMVSQESQSSASTVACGSTSENSDQPSPNSVLEPPFEGEDNAVADLSGIMKAQVPGVQLLSMSNVIDKSPSIGSIARTLSSDDSYSESRTDTLKPSLSMEGLVDREDGYFIVKRLLVLAGLEGEMLHNLSFARWHSHDSPLDPLLRDKDVDLCEEEALHVSEQSQGGSNWKLIFDCVNTVLVEISEHSLDRSIRGRPCGKTHSTLMEGGSCKLVDCVWSRMKEWFPEQDMCVPSDDGTDVSLVVESAVSKDVMSGSWVFQMRLEDYTLVKDIERELLVELLEETVFNLTGTISMG